MRTYDPPEIARILRRAAELEQARDAPSPVGLTADELRAIAKEAGIGERSLAAALAEEAGTADAASTWDAIWGGPLTLTLDRTVPAPLDASTWETMLDEVRRAFGDVGAVNTRATSQHSTIWEWAGQDNRRGVRQTLVTATTDGEATQIRVVWSEPILAVPTYVLSGALCLALVPVVFESLGMVSLAGLALYLTLATSLFLLARTVVARQGARRKAQVQQLMDRLEDLAATTSATTSAPAARAPEAAPSTYHASLVDIPDAEPTAEPSHASRSSERSR